MCAYCGVIACAGGGVTPRAALAQRLFSPGNIAPGSSSLDSPNPSNIVPQGSPLPRVLPSLPPAVGPGPSLPLAVPAAAPSGAVTVRSVQVEGITAYQNAQTAGITAGLTGRTVPLQRIEDARAELLNLYRGDGYALTTVTAAVDENGVLRFTVIEGRIAEVRLEGDIGPAGVQVLRFLNHLTELRPVDTGSLERWLLLAQDVPGVSLRAVLRPSSSEPGALTLIAQVDRQPVSGLLSVDNRAFPLTGPIEGLGLLDFNSFTQYGEKTEASVYHTDANTENFGQVSTEAFIGGSGLRARIYGGYGETIPSGFLRDADYHGTTTVFGASLIYPVIRARQQTLNISGFFDAIETRITELGANPGSLQRGFDSLRVLRIGADYALQDGWLGNDRPAINSVNIRVSQGLPALGATPNGDPDATRAGEQTNFTKAVIDMSRVQTLLRVGTDSNVALKARVIGQVTGSVLPPSEQFFLGGAEFNRGYYAGEVTGDNAFVWQAELQFNTSYDVQAFGRPFNLAAQFYGFYDHGQTWQNQSSDANTILSSEGIGVRLNVTRYTEFDVEGVIRNTRRLGDQSANVSPLKADAAYWRVITRF